MVANFIISGFTVYQSYAGPNSITTFISFFMLVSLKLYSSWNVGALSVKYERANSAYLREPKTYNTIDEDFRILDEENTVDIEIIENKNVENENVENKKEEQKIEL